MRVDQAVLNNTIDAQCLPHVSLIGGIGSLTYIVAENVNNTNISGDPNYSPNSYIFQKLNSSLPIITWATAQIGEDGDGDLKYNAVEDGEIIRVKYTQNGCSYYSNPVYTYFV